MAHNIETDIRHFNSARTSVLILASVFAAISALAILMNGAVRSVPVRPVVLHNAEQDAHCMQVVEIARSEFGPEWKRRLDPGKTACAQQIQTAWERDWSPRQALPDPVSPLTTITSAKRLAKVAPPEAVPAQGPEAYSSAKAAIIADDGARFADSDAAYQDDAIDSENSIEHSGAPDSSVIEDHVEGEVGNSEQAHELRRYLPSDSGANDEQADTTRELNNQQLIDHDRAHSADIGRSGDDESDADEDVGSHDGAVR